MEPGLHLLGRTYHRLSGPITLTYLHPPNNHPELPLVLLLGDRHTSHDLCDNCEVDKGCLNIIESPFFHALDELAREMPVDFFTETNWNHTPFNNTRQTLFHHFVKATQKCYDVQRRSIASDPCPTQFVRWHHVDTRLMMGGPYVEWHLTRVMSFFKQMYEKSESEPYDFIYPSYVMADFGDIPSTAEWTAIETAFATELIQRLFTPQQTKEQVTVGVVDLIFSHLRSHNSLIRKEVDRQDVLSLDVFQAQMANILFTSAPFTKAVEQIVQFLSLDPALMFSFRDIFLGILQSKQFFYRVPHELRTAFLTENIDLINYVIELIYHILIIATAPLLDIYAVTRMVKKPKGSDRGVLQVGYYGARHCEGISQLLVSLLQYTVKVDIHTDDKKENCLVIRDPIPIERDMEHLAHARYQAYPEHAREYKEVIQRESEGRLRRGGRGRYSQYSRRVPKGRRAGRRTRKNGRRRGRGARTSHLG